MKKYKVLYFGNVAKISEAIFLSEKFELVGVFAEKGRVSQELLYFSYLRNIKVYEVDSKKDLKDQSKELEVDFAIMCGFGIILDEKLLDEISVYNIHLGRLPEYKGRHPTFFATINGETHISYTLHKVTPEIDKGDIIDEYRIAYSYWKTENDLKEEILNGANYLLESLERYLEGKINTRTNFGGKYYPPVKESDKYIDVDSPPSKVLNLVRAQAAYGGALFAHGNKTYSVEEVDIFLLNNSHTVNGKIVLVENELVGIHINENHFIRFKQMKEVKK